MDTPNREVSWLESFPPDIWAYFVWYIPGEQLGRLKMTGATKLWRRIKSPEVVRSIKLGGDYLVFKSCPGFLNDFPSLEELSIHSPRHTWSAELGLTIESLPPGVRKLKLSGEWNSSKSFTTPACGHLNLSSQIPRMECLELSPIRGLDPIDIFPWIVHSSQTLTNLSIRKWDGALKLPSSLIHFKAYYAYFSSHASVELPSSLESFVVTYQLFGVEVVLPILPPSTHKLRLGDDSRTVEDKRFPSNLLEQLPKFLKTFRFPLYFEPQIDFKTNPESALLIPSTLTDLDMRSDFPCSVWRFLPVNLTKLSLEAFESLSTVHSNIIDRNGVQHEVTSIPFDALPRSITSLQLRLSEVYMDTYFCGPPTSTNLSSYFPPHLTHLFAWRVQLSPETAKLLPDSLTHLSIANLCERVCEHLPRDLKKLECSATLMSPNLFKFLPKSLTYVRMNFPPESYDDWFDYNTGKKFESLSKHPEYSLHEKCLSNRDWEDSYSLPPTLTYFCLNGHIEFGDSFMQHQQFPSLLDLALCSKRFTDLSIPLLSPHLTDLTLGDSNHITGKSFQFLPRSLTSLNLPMADSIVDSDIQHLPRTLKRVYMNRAVHLTDSCVPALPPHLEELHLRINSQITPSCLPYLPYPLRSRHFRDFRASVELFYWLVRYGEIEYQDEDPMLYRLKLKS